MKLFLMIFVIFVTWNKCSNACRRNFNSIAHNLLDKVIKLIRDIDGVQLDTVTLREKLTKLNDTIDFGIPNNTQLIKINEVINKHQLNRGIQACIDLKNNKIVTLIRELKHMLLEKVNLQLAKYKETLTDIHMTLQNIFDSVQGKYLNMEKKFCANNPQTCRLTVQYPNELNSDEQIINTIGNVTRTLIDLVLQSVINPIVSNKIYSEIYRPVIDCVSKL